MEVDEMLTKRQSPLPRFFGDQQGSYAVEFAIILPTLLLLLFGIIDFGHVIFMKESMVSASREGARYATVYQTDASGNRVLPINLTPSVANFIINTPVENGNKGGVGLKTLLPSDAGAVVAISGPASTESNPSALAGEEMTVTITATKHWLVIGKLIPGIGSSITLTTSTNMLCE